MPVISTGNKTMKNGMLQILSIALPNEPDDGSAFKSERQRVHFAP